VILVSDVLVFRDLMVAAIEDAEGIELAGGVPAAVASMEIGIAEPDVVLVDASADSATAGVAALAASAGTAKIVAIGIPDDEAAQLELIEAGVAGYVTAEQPLADVIDAVVAVSNGELRCSPRLSAALAERVAALNSLAPERKAEQGLTPREREVAALVSQGLSNKQIARRLSIQQATVKNHVHNILTKLGIRHRDEDADDEHCRET
jgi:DNA-binding NarL/FixJ family response regulator